ncbi:MAG TPA: hypothetical protein VMV79_02920 [Alphaproteobacteria bacterium]|nr:hypothetical protein [Alphaproteobacteria bacterium]
MIAKEWLGGVAVVIGFAGYGPYFLSVWRGATKPHAFSWIVWSLLSLIAFFAQASRGAGPGAWTTGANALFCFTVAMCGVFYGEREITRGDWLSFLAALAALPLWYVTADPLWAVIWITAIDMSAFYPTVRKSWLKPHEENLSPYIGDATAFALAFCVLGHYSLVTVMTPLFVVTANGAFVGMSLWRRRVVGETHS